MKNLLLCPVLAALVLSGCSVGHTEYSRTAMQHVDMSVTGIPTILGLGTLGTSIPLTPEYSLTAAHVAKLPCSASSLITLIATLRLFITRMTPAR